MIRHPKAYPKVGGLVFHNPSPNREKSPVLHKVQTMPIAGSTTIKITAFSIHFRQRRGRAVACVLLKATHQMPMCPTIANNQMRIIKTTNDSASEKEEKKQTRIGTNGKAHSCFRTAKRLKDWQRTYLTVGNKSWLRRSPAAGPTGTACREFRPPANRLAAL